MEKRILGKSDLKVAPLGLGTNVFGWTIDEKKSFEILDAFVAGGSTWSIPPTSTPPGFPEQRG